MNLSDNLKKLRKDKNLSQEQLAEMLGVSRQSVSKWESNQAYPEMDKVIQLCKLFNLNIDELLNQDIKELKESKESKNNINKYMDDFLNFITKTVNLFSSLKFKGKLKCLFEQIFISFILFLIFFLLEIFLAKIVENILNYNFYSLYNILRGVYILGATIIGIVILLHIFKTRYLDYYVVVDSDIKIDDKIEDENKQEIKRKEEKIIIRDPKHSEYRFIKGLLKCVLFVFKIFLSFGTVCLMVFLMMLVVSFVFSFLFVKTGLLFVGTLLSLVSLIVITLLIIYILYKFIFNKQRIKAKFDYIFIISISCIITLSIGIALIFISIKDFKFTDAIKSNDYITTEFKFPMEDDLVINEILYYSNYEFVEEDIEYVKIACEHSKTHVCSMEKFNNYVYISTYSSVDFNKLQQVIKDINNKRIIDYSNCRIVIYASKENIEKLKENITKHWN